MLSNPPASPIPGCIQPVISGESHGRGYDICRAMNLRLRRGPTRRMAHIAAGARGVARCLREGSWKQAKRDLIKQGPRSSCTSPWVGTGLMKHSCCNSLRTTKRAQLFCAREETQIMMDSASWFADSFYKNSDDEPQIQTFLSLRNTPQVSDGDLSTPAHATIARHGLGLQQLLILMSVI